MAQPIPGTIAETYLRNRGITALHDAAALRFHPRCYYRPDADAPTEIWPALIAAVTDLAGNITGVHRTWLDPTGEDKAPVDTPRRAMGHLLGHGVRFGVATDVMAAGEGIETMLSVRSALPDLPMVAALSANHLAALLFRVTLRRLYVVRDNDPAGDFAVATLTERAQAAGIEALTLSPTLGDFNEDLRRLGVDHLRAALRAQLAPEDVPRFLSSMDDSRVGTMSARLALQLVDRIGRGDRSLVGRGRARGLQEGDRTASGPGPQRRSAAIFRRRASPALHREDKIAAARRPPLRSGRCR